MIDTRDRQPSEDSTAGFALIEVLVALALLGLILAALVPSIDLIRRVIEVAEHDAQTPAHASIEKLLRQLLEQASPPTTPRPGTTASPSVFVGTANAMTFTSAFAPRGMRAGLYRYELRLVPSASNPKRLSLQLNYQQLSTSELASHKSLSDDIILVDDVPSLALSYFGQDPAHSSRAWQAVWADREKLPELIAIEIRVPRAPAAWPPIIVATRL